MTSKSTTEATVPQGDIYTISLNENPSTDYKWKVTHSSGLKLLSDTLSSGNRELKFRADQKGKQTIEADYCKSGRENSIIHTSEFVLDVV